MAPTRAIRVARELGSGIQIEGRTKAGGFRARDMIPDIPANKSTKFTSHGCVSDKASSLKRRLILFWQVELDFVQGIEKAGHRASQERSEGPMLPGQQVNRKC